MEREPLLSVVVITYNHEKYIRQALQSVLEQQTDFEYEILVGEDASTDATPQIVDEFSKSHSHLKCYHRSQNMGASANIYNLFQRASGKYIATLEGDDCWADCHKLQKQVRFLEENSDYIACTHECILVDEQNQMLDKQYLEWISKKEIFDVKESKGFYLAGQLGTLVFRNIFLSPAFDYGIIKEAHPMISDRTIQLVLALHGNIRRLPEKMSLYRQISNTVNQNATSVCFEQNEHSAYDNFLLTERLEEYAKQNAKKKYSFAYVKKLFFTSMVWQYLRTHNLEIKKDMKKVLSEKGTSSLAYWLFLPRGIVHKILEKRK